MKQENIKYKNNTMLAFIDVLGFKNRIQESHDDDSLFKLVQVIENIILEAKKECSDFNNIIKIEHAVFSDSLIIWSEINAGKDLTGFLICLGRIVLSIHTNCELGVILRGSVNFGSHYSDVNRSIWISKVFVEAYDFEKKVGTPGIYFHASAIEKIKKTSPDLIETNFFYKEIGSDGSEKISINYLYTHNYRGEKDKIIAELLAHIGELQTRQDLPEYLTSHKEFLISNLENKNYCIKIHSKYAYLGRYHDKYLEDCRLDDPNLTIDESFFRQ